MKKYKMNKKTIAPFTFLEYKKYMMGEFEELDDKVYLIELWIEETRKLKRKLIGDLIRQNYENDTLPEFDAIKEAIFLQKSAYANIQNKLYIWLTLNPKAPYTQDNFKLFKDKVVKFVNRKIFRGHMYVFEQRSTAIDTLGEGYHAHILLKRNISYKPSNIHKYSKNTFKNLMNVHNPSIFKFNWCPQEFLGDKIQYMKGYKIDINKEIETQKLLKCEVDKEWRTLWGIHQFYGTSKHFPH